MKPQDLGKAYLAYSAYNFKIKVGRIKDFDPKRWFKVVQAIESGTAPKQRRAVKTKGKKPLVLGHTWKGPQTGRRANGAGA